MVNKTIKRIAVTVSLLMVICAFPGSIVFAAEIESDRLTIEKYEEYLRSESMEDYIKFIKLSESEKQLFVDALQDPGTYANNRVSNDVVKRSFNYCNYETSVAVHRATGRTSEVSRDTWGTETVTILGIDVLEYKIEAGYMVSGNKIKSINYYDAYVVKNLNPMCQTSTQGKYAYISNNRVYTKGTFYYKIGPIKGLSVQIGNVYGQLVSYPNGSSSVSYWRE